MIVNEPALDTPDLSKSRVVCDLAMFRAEADVIVANHLTVKLRMCSSRCVRATCLVLMLEMVIA